MAAAACRSRPSWPTACAASCRIRRGIPSCRPRCANGCASSAAARPCRSSDRLLIESFPRGSKQFIVAYCFEGRNAHQTLGMLLTRRMERMGLKPLGFVATDYVLGLWGLRPPTKAQLDQLFDEDMLGDDLEAWMDESTMLRRSFRNVAVIAGLIERRYPGEEKIAPPGHLQLRPDLRRAAQARARPHPAARHAPGRRLAARRPASAWAICCGAPRAASTTAGSTASRRSPCRCCWRSARSGCWTAPPRTSCWTSPRRN